MQDDNEKVKIGVVDLGSLDWTKNNDVSYQGYNIFYTYLNDGAVSCVALCSLFQNNPAPSSGGESLAGNELYIGSNYLAICSITSYPLFL